MIVTHWSQPAIDPPVAGWSLFALGPPVTRWTEVPYPAPIGDWSILSSFVPEAHLTAPLLTNSQTFYAPAMIASLAPSLLTNTPIFFGPTTTLRLAPALFTSPQAFYAPASTQSLAPSLLSNLQIFYGPTLAKVLNPPLLTNGQTFYGATTTQRMAPALFTNSQTFFAAAIAGPTVKTYIGSTSDASNAASFTFTNHAIGSASAGRLVVVAITGFTNPTSTTVTSVTIGGNAATIDSTTNVSTVRPATFAYLTVPSGTTATIAVNFSSVSGGCSVSVYTLTGLLSTTPVDSDTSSANPASVTLTTAVEGAAIGIATGASGADTAWTNLTEDYDAVVTSVRRSAASVSGISGASLNIQANMAVTTRMSAAAWR